MKSVKSIVKNYLTGKEYVEIKRKPNLPIKGYANVYLYNARTGKLELEAHTPNIIYPEVYEWLRSYQWDKFCTGAYNKTNSYGGYWEMDNIYLSTSSRPEDERVNILTFNTTSTSDGNPGVLIGWANKSTYTGSDTQRGTPNTAESYANNSQIHWVFDWPTHAANGTFQTLIWGNKFAPYFDTVMSKKIGISTPSSAGFDITTDGTYIYAIDGWRTLYKIMPDGTVLGSVNTGISVPDTYSSIGITYLSPYLYALLCNGKLYQITTDGIIISTKNLGISTNSQHGFGLATDGTYLYAMSVENKFYKISTDGIVIDTYTTNLNLSSPYQAGFSMHYIEPFFYTYAPNYYNYKLSSTGEILASISSPETPGGATIGITYLNGYLYALKYDGTLYKWKFGDHYFARTLLAAPVTKTDQQTMKVQYNFVYEG